MTEPDFDAVVVGASVAGCTAARLFAQRGARVALVERRPDVDAYKTVCTHYIQPSATPTIEKLGLAALIEEHGADLDAVLCPRRRHGGCPSGTISAAVQRDLGDAPSADKGSPKRLIVSICEQSIQLMHKICPRVTNMSLDGLPAIANSVVASTILLHCST